MEEGVKEEEDELMVEGWMVLACVLTSCSEMIRVLELQKFFKTKNQPFPKFSHVNLLISLETFSQHFR